MRYIPKYNFFSLMHKNVYLRKINGCVIDFQVFCNVSDGGKRNAFISICAKSIDLEK